ncbi:MAG: TetR family transcriptional regulator [Proteobacteria bacterium]|nr:TetR family transcriptional regulator [Pseudomonadota bacterium]
MQTRRERVRQAAIDEIKTVAWEIASEHGLDDVTVNGITRRMGMTPPAFYSYFKSRNELIRALVVDSYRSYRRTLTTARDSLPEADNAGRLYRVFIAYREWAITNPNLFGLFAGRMVHGFDPPVPEIVEEAEKVYDIFIELYNDAWQQGSIKQPQLALEMSQAYRSQIEKSKKQRNLDAPVEVVNLVLNSACLVHGVISMELSGRFNSLVGDPFLFYQYQILDLLKKFGMDYTPNSD